MQIAIAQNKSVKCEIGHTSLQGNKLLTGSEATIRERGEDNVRESRNRPYGDDFVGAVDLRWVELKHPHVPSVAEVQ
jgi:hypothetical protein